VIAAAIDLSETEGMERRSTTAAPFARLLAYCAAAWFGDSTFTRRSRRPSLRLFANMRH
jgi:hypothetical protein